MTATFTRRLPVLLARQQGIPTLDFHHGALDGRFLLKNLSSDLYLAKGEMERDYLVRVCRLPAERVILAGPPLPRSIPAHEHVEKERRKDESPLILFFSEPYEVGRLRTEDIYREILTPLARLASKFGRRLVVKLHPFESRAERMGLVAKVLPPENAALVDVLDGPFTPEMVARAWFAVTVESTVVIDCSLARSSMLPVRVVDLLALRIYRSIRPLWSWPNPELSGAAQRDPAPAGGADDPVIRRLSVKADGSRVVAPHDCCGRSHSENVFAGNKLAKLE